MAQLSRPLPDQPGIKQVKILIVLAVVNRGRLQQRNHLLDALHPPARGLDRVGVAHRLAVIAGIRAPGVGHVEPVPRRGVLFPRPLIQGRPLLVRRPGRGNRGIAPMGGVLVPRTNPGNQILDVDSVLGLGRVIEAGVIHDRRRVAHPLDPGPASNRVNRVRRTPLLVVLVAQRVADLVRHNKFHQPSHERVRKRPHPRPGIQMADLGEVPRPLQIHDVVIHIDVRLEDFAGPRIVDVRAGGVLHRRRKPADHRIPSVFRGPVRILRLARSVLGDDALPKSGSLERHLPLLDPPPHVGLEPVRRVGIDVIGDRLDRFGDGGVRVLLLESPPHDILSLLSPLLRPAVVELLEREEPDPFIGQPRHHRLFRQLDHAPVHPDRSRPGRRRGKGVGRRRARQSGGGRRERQGGLHFHIGRERKHLFHERPRRVGHPPELGPGAEFRGRRGVQLRDLDHGGAIRPVRIDVERRDDHVIVRVPNRLIDRRGRVGDRLIGNGPEQHPVIPAFPSENVGPAHLLSAVTGIERHPRGPGHQQHVLAQFPPGNLEVHPAPDSVSLKQPGPALRLRRDNRRVRLGRRISPGGGSRPAKAPPGGVLSLSWNRPDGAGGAGTTRNGRRRLSLGRWRSGWRGGSSTPRPDHQNAEKRESTDARHCGSLDCWWEAGSCPQDTSRSRRSLLQPE